MFLRQAVTCLSESCSVASAFYNAHVSKITGYQWFKKYTLCILKCHSSIDKHESKLQCFPLFFNTFLPPKRF